MGQQQLLLLVLSTVIVGLATVAGIQAFSENQQQATQDALIQRAISLGNEVKAAHDTPDQLGGVTIGGTTQSAVADAIGLSDASSIPADGAGDSAECSIDGVDTGTTATVNCGSNGPDDGTIQIDVTVDPDADDPVTVNTIDVTS